MDKILIRIKIDNLNSELELICHNLNDWVFHYDYFSFIDEVDHITRQINALEQVLKIMSSER